MSTSTVNISAAQVKELRDKSGAPMMDCKKALAEAKGDLEQAIKTSITGARGGKRERHVELDHVDPECPCHFWAAVA